MSSSTSKLRYGLIDTPEVKVEPVDATVCGAVGCRVKEALARVRISGFGQRVVCPEHLADLVTREVGV